MLNLGITIFIREFSHHPIHQEALIHPTQQKKEKLCGFFTYPNVYLFSLF